MESPKFDFVISTFPFASWRSWWPWRFILSLPSFAISPFALRLRCLRGFQCRVWGCCLPKVTSLLLGLARAVLKRER